MCTCKINKTIKRQNLLWETSFLKWNLGKYFCCYLKLTFCNRKHVAHLLLHKDYKHTYYVVFINYKATAWIHTTNFLWTAGPLINEAQDNFSLSFTNRWGLFLTLRLYRNNASILQTFVEGTFINAPIPNLPGSAGLVFTVSTCLKRLTMSHHLQPGH